jgi:hypothetical protein
MFAHIRGRPCPENTEISPDRGPQGRAGLPALGGHTMTKRLVFLVWRLMRPVGALSLHTGSWAPADARSGGRANVG